MLLTSAEPGHSFSNQNCITFQLSYNSNLSLNAINHLNGLSAHRVDVPNVLLHSAGCLFHSLSIWIELTSSPSTYTNKVSITVSSIFQAISISQYFLKSITSQNEYSLDRAILDIQLLTILFVVSSLNMVALYALQINHFSDRAQSLLVSVVHDLFSTLYTKHISLTHSQTNQLFRNNL